MDKSKVYYYKVQASDKEDDKSLEENVTDYSNEVRVLLLNEDEDKARELKFEVTADGYVIVDLECEPTASSRIYIYNVTGQLVEVVVPTSRKVQLPRLQENGQVIVKFSDGGGLKRKEKFAKIFY